MARMTPEEVFQGYRQKLEKECVAAFSVWTVYKQIENYIHTHNKMINVSPAFYSVCRGAFLSQVVILISKILEKRKKYSLSLQRYLAFIEENESILKHPPQEGVAAHLERDKKSLNDFEDTRKKLKAWRDKELAHTDIRTLNGSSRAKRPLVKEVDDLFNLIEQVFNRYSSYYDRRQFTFKLINIGDLSYTIDLVEKAMKQKRSF